MRARFTLHALAAALLLGAAAHQAIPHQHPWDADEAYAAPAPAVLPPITMHGGDVLEITGSGCVIHRNVTGNQPTANLRLTCQGAATGTATSTATGTATAMPSSTATQTPSPSSTATRTPTPPPSSTATATAMPSSTATQTPPPAATATTTPTVAQIEGVPICTDHNATVWHPLVRRNAAGAIVCTYGHEHHADPNSMNDVFGPPGAWYGGNQSISYPWQTSSTLGQENVVKHEGYKWYTQRDLPCKPGWAPPEDGCLISWRVQVHSMGTASDAVVRFHSFSMEAVVEYHGVRGIVRHGGHLDFGELALLVDGGNAQICPGVPTDPPGVTCGDSPHRDHASANVPPPHQPHGPSIASWYSSHRLTSLSTGFEVWGPIDYQNPAAQLFFDPSIRANNSNGGIGNMAVTSNEPDAASYTQNGIVTMSAYTDSAGVGTSGCSAPSPTCVPIRFEHVPSAIYVWNAGVQGNLPPNIEYDQSSPVTGRSLIKFPN